MFVPVIAFMIVSAAAPAPDQRHRVIVFDLTPSGGVEQGVVENITGLCASILAEDDRFDVLSGVDLRQMLALEGQKEAAGCGDDGSCIAELAGALNARFVLFGNVGYIGSTLNLNLALFDQRTKSARRTSVQAKDLDAVPAALRSALRELVGAREGDGSGLRVVAAVAGIVGIAAGGALLTVSVSPSFAIADEEANLRDGDAAAFDRARGLQNDWYASGLAYALAVGGALLVAGGAAALTASVVIGDD